MYTIENSNISKTFVHLYFPVVQVLTKTIKSCLTYLKKIKKKWEN